MAKPETPTAYDRNGDSIDVGIAIMVALAIYGALAVFAWKGSEHTGVLLFSGLCGVAAGWAVGIVISPYNKNETKRFGRISGVVYGFLTGYLVSKVDKLIGAVFDPESSLFSERLILCLGMLLATFLTTIAFTYVTRVYWVEKHTTVPTANQTATPAANAPGGEQRG